MKKIKKNNLMNAYYTGLAVWFEMTFCRCFWQLEEFKWRAKTNAKRERK